jgi:hypothetical protein
MEGPGDELATEERAKPTQTLHALREAAPDEAARARVADVLESLQAVRSAMETEHSPGAARASQQAQVHALLMSFEASLSALRLPGDLGAA